VLRRSLGESYPYYSPNDILNTGELCLSALGKRAPVGIKLFPGNGSLEYAAANESGPFLGVSSETGKKFTVAVNSKNAPKKDVADSDSVVFLKAPAETKQDVFCLNVSALLTATYRELDVKAFKIIGEGGLLEALLTLTKGAFLNLSPLYPVFYNISPELLTSKLTGSAIAIIPSSKIRRFTECANANGLYAYPIGRPAKAGRLNITSSYGTPYSLTYDFIRSLKMKNGISVKTSDEHKNGTVSEKFVVDGIDSEYAYYQNGIAVINAEANVNSYNSAALTLLNAVCRASSIGISREDVLTSFELGISFGTEKESGESLSAILGVYRAQSELSVSSSNVGTVISNEPYCSVTLAARGKKDPEITFKKSGSRVYLLAPRYKDNGLPDFKDERLLLDYVNELFKSGEIISARAVGANGAATTVSKMNSDTAKLEITDISEKSGIGSFIVETDSEISGLFLGFTE